MFYLRFSDCCSLGGEDLAGEQVEDGVDAEGVGNEHHDGDEQGHQAEDVVHLSMSSEHHRSDFASWRPPSMLSLSPSIHGRIGIRRVEEKVHGQKVTMYKPASPTPPLLSWMEGSISRGKL